MPKIVKFGTGITERDMTTWDPSGKTPGDVEAHMEWLNEVGQSIEQFGLFGADTEIMRRVCNKILEGWPPDSLPEAHTREDYARRILHELKFTDACIEEGAAEHAATSALQVGLFWQEAAMKFRWEDDAIRGEKVAGGAKNSAHLTNARHDALREQRFLRMATLIPTIGIDKAAVQCETEQLGHRDAIKRQWNRHKEKRDS
jgi:hypothetical protein